MRVPSRRRAERAQRVWTQLQSFVEGHARHGEVQRALGLGAGAGRVKVLFRLRGGPMTLSEIAEAHGVDAPYATIIVDRLESLGLVTRQPHPDDRRRKLVTLTPAGWEAAATAEGIVREPPPSLSALSAAQLGQLEELLARLR
jgi:DNA-binding MarR family transcriptional regulator